MMAKSGPFAAAAASLLVSVAYVDADSSAAPRPRHPGMGIDLPPRFRASLRCPHADKWLAEGPEQAVRSLGLAPEHVYHAHDASPNGNGNDGRRLIGEMEVQGSCSYTNPWSGDTCLQFDGSSWTAEAMSTRCAVESGTWSADGCPAPTGGWCAKTVEEGRAESTTMSLSPTADCDGSKMACANFMGGTFVAAGECAGGSVDAGSEDAGNMFAGSGPPPGVADSAASAPPTKCLLAPGAIGAAHQLGFSKGYNFSCPEAPAAESPYMWPMKWSADTENQAMAYGSDDVVYKSRGRTYYMLDKNWKRSDTTYQEGVLRAIVTGGPCDNLDEDGDGIAACYKNQTEGMWTMLHLENMMYFVDWKPDAAVSPGELDAAKIANCTELNMAVVGNIRPDWFLDRRGDDTDVQYLGDQHVYYADADASLPKLVKQWRKKDFASQYFVMSVMANPPNKLAQDDNAPVEDDMHWPLILNVPGEGFGDDSLQVYRNHALLSDEDEEIFQLVESYKAQGGVCVSGAGGGPAEGEGFEDADRPHIPSNLEVDPESWYTNEVTFSPFFEPKGIMASDDASATTTLGGKTILEVSDRVVVESCYDETSKAMDMTVRFKGMEATSDDVLPWMAVGYRETVADVDPMAHKTELLPSAKVGEASVFASMYAAMTPLGDVEGYADVMVEAGDDEVALSFKQEVGAMPEEDVYMLFAIGMGAELGYHTTRGCFQVKAT
ncbi:hypothetical protein ACHAWF_003724, partial [Thalassiosira exigua]